MTVSAIWQARSCRPEISPQLSFSSSNSRRRAAMRAGRRERATGSFAMRSTSASLLSARPDDLKLLTGADTSHVGRTQIGDTTLDATAEIGARDWGASQLGKLVSSGADAGGDLGKALAIGARGHARAWRLMGGGRATFCRSGADFRIIQVASKDLGMSSS
jgi:hypothetical protein